MLHTRVNLYHCVKERLPYSSVPAFKACGQTRFPAFRLVIQSVSSPAVRA